MSIEKLDVGILDLLRTMKSLSLRELARKTNNSHGNLSTWFQGKISSLSNERAEEIQRVLGIDPLTGRLFSGIHRWTIPSETTYDIEKAEYIIRELCLGRVRVYPLRSANLVQAIVTASLGNFLPWIAWVLVPVASPQIRIVLSIKPSAKHMNFIGSFRSLSPKFFGGILPDGSSPEEIPSSAWIPIRPEIFLRVKSDPELTVHDLDAILGISGSPEWTWERLTAVLQGKGITPEETARKMGIF